MAASEQPYEDWVKVWRQGVRASPHAAWLVELASKRFLELSPAAARLLSTTPERGVGVDYLSVAEAPVTALQVFDAVESGAVEALQARRRFRIDGRTPVEVVSVARAVRCHCGPDLSLWVADRITTEGGEPEWSVPRFESQSRSQTRLSPVAFADLDGGWRLENVRGDLEGSLGLTASHLPGRPVVETVSPRDIAALLWALAQATSSPASAVSVRVRTNHSAWRPVEILVSAATGEGEPRFGLALAPISADHGDWPLRLSQLEQRVSRMASHLDGFEAPATNRWLDGADLTPRQIEIVARLVRGERVPGIARALFVAQSTVRNHLATVFRKFGVTSQEELISRLRDAP